MATILLLCRIFDRSKIDLLKLFSLTPTPKWQLTPVGHYTRSVILLFVFLFYHPVDHPVDHTIDPTPLTIRARGDGVAAPRRRMAAPYANRNRSNHRLSTPFASTCRALYFIARAPHRLPISFSTITLSRSRLYICTKGVIKLTVNGSFSFNQLTRRKR